MYILGVGGMGREVLTYYHDMGLINSVEGFVEQNCSRSGQLVRGKRILDETELPDATQPLKLIGGIGNPIRKAWIEALEARKYRFDILIHDQAYVGENVIMGSGTVVCPGSLLTCDLTIGRHCIINIKASISHDCKLGDYVTVSPGATIGGRVEVGDGSWIGIGATIIQDIKIGKNAFVAAGAVVVEDVPDNALVIGVPARVSRNLLPEDWKHLLIAND